MLRKVLLATSALLIAGSVACAEEITPQQPLPGNGMFVIRFMGIRLAFGPRYVRSAPRRHYASAPRNKRVVARDSSPRREARVSSPTTESSSDLKSGTLSVGK
jgi:hypothetical protein